jgi:hypothetical protein
MKLTRLVALLLTFGLLGASLAGCGSGQPDPRTRPGFRDTSNPDEIRMDLPPPGPGGQVPGGQSGAQGTTP